MFAQVIFSAVLLVTAPGNIAAREAGDTKGLPERPALHDYSRAADEALRAEALAHTLAERAGPVRTLCQLHDALRRDPRTETNDAYTELENKLFLRLRKVKADLEKQIAKEAKAADPRTSHPASDAGLLAQAAQAAAPGAPGGGLVVDEGQQLVDLIQRTIQPEMWDVNGGRSSIVYYAPLRVLVVSAPAEVHGDMSGILRGLRAAGP